MYGNDDNDKYKLRNNLSTYRNTQLLLAFLVAKTSFELVARSSHNLSTIYYIFLVSIKSIVSIVLSCMLESTFSGSWY